ncbi:11381_t:CDS:2 [Cetraspora pellucida]|uniref:11381_t:CDS:1 n=1 Tax=Cetraspora pellucida TaxID=1433469 RepID=A0ACA9K0L1_9GLOM|nr:11381_t:CDS:2 [Cetraspora pellucida]
MDDDNLQSSFLARQIDKSIADPITRSNSSASETRSMSAKSDNDAPNVPTIKKTKLKTVQNLDNQKINVEVTYGICNVLNDSDKCCDSRVKVSDGSTSNLISHLLNTDSIMQNVPELSEQDNDNDKKFAKADTDRKFMESLSIPNTGLMQW